MTNECSGSCLCGAVRFRTKGSLRGVVYCHCSQCRKQTGLYYAATDVDVSNVTLEGEDQLTWYAASDFARRGFQSQHSKHDSMTISSEIEFYLFK